MATSGSNVTWSSNGGHYVKVTWNETSQSTTENRSAVTVRLYIGSKSGWSISDSSNSYSLTINGTTYSGSNASISQTGSEDLILTKDVIIYHDSDGTKSFSMKGAISGLYFGSISGTTFSGTLDKIARKSTMSSSANMTAGWNKTVSISRASSSFNHIVEVYVTRGATEKLIRTESFGTSETSKTLEWSNTQIREMFNNGYGYWTGTKFVLTTRSGTTSVGTNTYTGDLDWPSNNSVASMQNSINVGSSFSVDINKASSLYSHEIKLTLTNGTSLATQSISSGTSFTMTPPSATIYSVGSNSTSVTVELWIRTVLTASTATEVRGWTREKASSVIIPNTPPTMGTMSYTELNTTIANIMLTNGVPNPVLVQGYSHPKFTFTAASPKNSASIVNYTVSIGGESLSRTDAGSLDFTPANLGGRTIKVGANTSAILTATDSRGFTNSISIPVTYLPYSPPTVTLNTKRVNGFSDSVELTGSATISALAGKNSVAASGGFRYKYRVLPAAFGTTYTPAASTMVNGYPTLTKVTETISNESAYEFEVVVTDRITSTTVRRAGSPGKPIAFMDSKLLSVGVNRFPTGSRRFEVQDEMMISAGVASAKIAPHFAGNTNKSIIRFEQVSGSNDPGMIVHETSASSTSADNNKGVIHLMPSDDSDNANDYVTVRATNFALPENVRIYTGGNAWFNGQVSAGSVSVGSSGLTSTGALTVSNLGQSIQLSGRDISINGKRALVGFETSSHNRLDINYTNDYANGIKMYGPTEVTDMVTISTNSECLRLKGIDHEYISFYNGSTRQGYVGQGSTASTDITVTADVGNAVIRSMTGDVILSGNTVKAAGGLQGSLRHTSGYMEIASFSSGYGTGQAELWYDANGRRLQISSRNSADTGARDINVHAYNFVGRLNGTSSIKFKRNVEDYTENALEKINASRVRTYNYTYDKDEDRHVGIIIEENAPKEIVSLEGETVDIYGMVSMSWRAIQQLSEENKSLKKEKKAMKTRMTKLEKKNKELEDRLARVEALLEGGN